MVRLHSVQGHTGLMKRFQFFWYSGTLALSPERQSAWMSEIENGGLDQYGAERLGRLTFATVRKISEWKRIISEKPQGVYAWCHNVWSPCGKSVQHIVPLMSLSPRTPSQLLALYATFDTSSIKTFDNQASSH